MPSPPQLEYRIDQYEVCVYVDVVCEQVYEMSVCGSGCVYE